MQYNIFWRKKIRNRPLPLDWPGCHQHFLKKLWCNFWGVRGVARHNRPWAGGFGPLQTKQSDVTLGVQRDPESVRGRLGRAGPAAKEGGKRTKLLGRKGMMWDSAELLRSLSLRCASTSERNNWAARVSTEWVFVWSAWCQSCRPASLNVNTMDQSVAIQETLEREENCIMVSFPTHTHWFVVDQRIRL